MSDDSSDDEPLASRCKGVAGRAVAVKKEVVVKEEVPNGEPKRHDNGATRRVLESDSDSDSDIPIMMRKKLKTEDLPSLRHGSLGPGGHPSFFDAKPSQANRPTPANRPVRSVVKNQRNGKKRPAVKPLIERKQVKKEIVKEKDVKMEDVKEDSSEEEKKPERVSVKKPKDEEPKWTTLEHGGVMFPPEYEPHGVKMLYNGHEVELNAEEEEVATMFAVMMETDYYKKQIFRKNFWTDFTAILKKTRKDKLMTDLEKCDFTPIFEWHKAKKEKEKADKAEAGAEGRKKAKEEKDRLEKPYRTALVDGKVENVGNFRVEPPGLFRGRGEHPKMGKLKVRVYPKDITINIGPEAKIPPLPEVYRDQTWKEIRHDNTVTWLAYWKDPVNSSQYKYVWLAANSGFKTDADLQKYEKARLLKENIDRIRNKYTDLAKKESYKESQMGTAMYFIDKLALRAGHEKDEDEADTVGCCNLKVENVMLEENNRIKFDFLGKDSIRYENTVQVEPRYYENVKKFKAKFGRRANYSAKKEDDQLFCELDATVLNQFLKDLMPGLSVKVFRTFNASITLDRLLNEDAEETAKEVLVDKKIAHYNTANKEVAILCNHQRSIPKTHDDSMKRMQEKMEKANDELRWLMEERKAAKRGDKAFTRADGKEAKPLSIETLTTRIENKKQQIHKMEIQAENKEALKTVALGTSKINYLDPRITVAWCKRNEVPIDKVFNKALLVKFLWAMDIEPDFRF